MKNRYTYNVNYRYTGYYLVKCEIFLTHCLLKKKQFILKYSLIIWIKNPVMNKTIHILRLSLFSFGVAYGSPYLLYCLNGLFGLNNSNTIFPIINVIKPIVSDSNNMLFRLLTILN